MDISSPNWFKTNTLKNQRTQSLANSLWMFATVGSVVFLVQVFNLSNIFAIICMISMVLMWWVVHWIPNDVNKDHAISQAACKKSLFIANLPIFKNLFYMVIVHIALTIGSLLLQGTSFNVVVRQYSLQGHHTLLKYDGCQMKPKNLSTSWQLNGVLLQMVMLYLFAVISCYAWHDTRNS